MRAVVTAVIAAIEAVAVALVGIAVVVVPGLLLWIFTFGLSAEPIEAIGGSISVWFLAHLVPIGFEVGAEAAVGLGLPQQAFEYPLSLAPLGLTCITVIFAARSGLRFGRRGGLGIAAVLGGALGFGASALLVLPAATSFLNQDPVLAVVAPAAIYGITALGGFVVRAALDDHPWWSRLVRWKQQGIAALGLPGSAAFPARAATGVRVATAATLAVVALAATASVVALLTHYVQIITLSQSLQLDPIGVIIVFLLQLLLLPVMVIWAASWLSGAGFALGIGSSVTPFETLLGPVPAVPIFGAIPAGWGNGGLLAPTLVVLAGVLVGALFSRRSSLRRATWTATLSIAAASAAGSGLVFVGAGALARGGIGPDRLTETGPSPWIFGGLIAAELCVGLMAGFAAGKLDANTLTAVLPRSSRPNAAGDDDLDGFGDLADDDDAEQATIPLDEVVSDMRSPRWPRKRPAAGEEDESSVEAAPEAAPETGSEAGETDPSPERDREADEAEFAQEDTEALVRAYSWDQGVAPAAPVEHESHQEDDAAATQPMPTKRRGWPFTRSGG